MVVRKPAARRLVARPVRVRIGRFSRVSNKGPDAPLPASRLGSAPPAIVRRANRRRHAAAEAWDTQSGRHFGSTVAVATWLVARCRLPGRTSPRAENTIPIG